jgi:hypothetical protein
LQGCCKVSFGGGSGAASPRKNQTTWGEGPGPSDFASALEGSWEVGYVAAAARQQTFGGTQRIPRLPLKRQLRKS